ncbi:sterol desaturase family protein [Caenimonas sedimenti]|uniref:Sterol desaturase family protein n=1 Tax=Caenimonas sedimenti TaxID=2596921 RepID=A0A562ZQC3_9BURK|nr:sterol desaturase family protein [Caenimonas sedimenti]TWO70792.1 sterol desaturase family protein [Caenimonas sedimenti]
MNPLLQNTLILALIAGFACMEYVSRRYRDTVQATANDTRLEVLMFLSLIAISQPLALFGSNALCAWLMPAQRNVFADLPWWAMVAAFLVADDMTQYWWHRLSHTPLLWPLHRAHHSANYMSIRITYRNNFFYYLMMPGLWLGGVLLYLGMGQVYVTYLVVKIAVILGAHSAWRWDEPLYRVKALAPVMWVVERTISTPATHWAHHALTNRDGIGHYKGNFGNLLFFWDVLFGSAHITRQYPPAVGLQDDRLFGAEHWAHQMFYPLARSKREHSALRPGGRPYEDGQQEVQVEAHDLGGRMQSGAQ